MKSTARLALTLVAMILLTVFTAALPARGFAPAAAAEPWSVTGQTKLLDQFTSYGTRGVENPAANLVGLLGEAEWPYQVPPGKTLVIQGMGFEGHRIKWESSPLYVIFLWVTDSSQSAALLTSIEKTEAALFSCAATLWSNVCPVRFAVPAGKWVHMTILNPTNSPATHGWHVWGELVDAP